MGFSEKIYKIGRNLKNTKEYLIEGDEDYYYYLLMYRKFDICAMFLEELYEDLEEENNFLSNLQHVDELIVPFPENDTKISLKNDYINNCKKKLREDLK